MKQGKGHAVAASIFFIFSKKEGEYFSGLYREDPHSGFYRKTPYSRINATIKRNIPTIATGSV